MRSQGHLCALVTAPTADAVNVPGEGCRTPPTFGREGLRRDLPVRGKSPPSEDGNACWHLHVRTEGRGARWAGAATRDPSMDSLVAEPASIAGTADPGMRRPRTPRGERHGQEQEQEAGRGGLGFPLRGVGGGPTR